MSPYQPTEFSTTLQRLRAKSGKSRYKLAQYSGVTESYILRLESGEKHRPSRDMVMKLSFALVADSSPVISIHDINDLLLAGGHAPLLGRGEMFPAI